MIHATDATYNVVNDRLFVTFDERLPEDEYQAIKAAGFQWWPRGVFTATWTPQREDLLRERFGVTDIEVLEDEDDVESRVARYADHADNAHERSERHSARVKSICDGIPFGQPILVGHHSEGRARADQKRIENGMHAWVEEHRKSEYWQDRAASAAKRAKRREQPGAIKRRIERLEAERRKMEKIGAARWTAHLDLRLTYERALYEESGGLPTDNLTIRPGDYVVTRGRMEKVVKVNRKTVSVSSGYSWLDKIRFDEIKQVIPQEEVAEESA